MVKKYAELCQPGGFESPDFNVNQNLSNCIVTMIRVQIDAVYDKNVSFILKVAY